MKRLIKLSVLLIALICFSDTALAASGNAYIHYYNETTPYGTANRSLTYTQASPHLQSMGYRVYGYNAQGIEQAYTQIQTARVFVVHNHGEAGLQYMDAAGYKFIAGLGNETVMGSPSYPTINGIIINNLSSGALSGLKIAILYGCNTGIVGPIRGNLPQLMVNKGATTAVAWKVSTIVDSVNEWNRLFFEKAKSDTIVESYRHADYWLETIQGSSYASIMSDNRNEAGNIYATIY